MPGESRPDLAALPVDMGVKYVWDIVMPPLELKQTAGKLYYHDIQADSAVQTGRTSGNAPTAVILAPSNVDFTAAEAIKRYRLPYEQVKNFGGTDTGLRIGAKAAKRSVFRGLETAVADAIYGATGNAAIAGTDGSFLTDIETAKIAVERAEGLGLYLVCGEDAFFNIIGIAEVQAELARSNSGLPPAKVRTADTLASLLGLDGVILGKKAHWGASGSQDYRYTAALMVLPNPEQDAVLVEAQACRMLVYYPNDEPFWAMEVADNTDERGWDIDVLSHYQVKLLNAEGIQVLTNIDGNAGYFPTTTTTTTT